MVTTGYWGSSMHIKFMTLNNGLQVQYTVCTFSVHGTPAYENRVDSYRWILKCIQITLVVMYHVSDSKMYIITQNCY